MVRITGCDRENLLDDFRRVHQSHHDSEHPFSLLETLTVREMFHGLTTKQIARELDSAFHAFNSQRKISLELLPGVREGLEILKQSNVTLVAHTESKLFAVVDRLTRLDITSYFSRIYCRERSISGHPEPEIGKRWLDSFPMEKVVELSHHQIKPDPDVLIEICAREEFAPEDSAYVGDSMARDILMAKRGKVFSIWAKYGAQHSEEEYARLVRVSHWTPDEVERERRLREETKGIMPDFIAEQSFTEVLGAIGLSNRAGGKHELLSRA